MQVAGFKPLLLSLPRHTNIELNSHVCFSISVKSDFFNGMIYPKGLSKNSTCMTEYINQEARLSFNPILNLRIDL
jgi:hypothetical protein